MEKPEFIVKKISVNGAGEFSKIDHPGKRDVPKSVGIILISLLVVSILFGAIRRHQLRVLKDATEIRVDVEHKLSEARAIFLLNPTRSRELIISARSVLDNYSPKDLKNIRDLVEKVEDAERVVLGDYKKDPQLFFDLTLFSEDFMGDQLFIEGNSLYVFDKKAKKVASINTGSKRSEIIAGPQLVGDADQIMPQPDNILYLNKTGVHQAGGKRVLDQNFEDGVIGRIFASNLYVLKPSESQIYRHEGVSDAFSGGVTWIDEGEDLDLSQTKNMIIDGSLWVLSNDGQITKLSQGKKTAFGIKGFDMQGFFSSVIFTDEDSEHLYLLDSKGGKILVTKKSGEYEAQYSSEGLKGILDFTVYEKIKKAFLLTGDKLLYLDLDHL